MKTPRPEQLPFPDWYSPEMAAADRLHDGVAWRCRTHGSLSAQYVLTLGTFTYCGSCLQDGTETPDHLFVVSQPFARPVDGIGRVVPRPRRPTVEPRSGTRMAAVLAQVRSSPSGIRHIDVVNQHGACANAAIRDLSRRGLIFRAAIGLWRASPWETSR